MSEVLRIVGKKYHFFLFTLLMVMSILGYCDENSVFIDNGAKLNVHKIEGTDSFWEINVGGENDPVMDFIEIKGPCENYKLLNGGVDFTSPKTVIEGLVKPEMGDSEKTSLIYHFVTQNFYNKKC